ncbi:ubiquitin carboxyl-terminal hydrolase 14 [Streptosporangium canum]|uniref:Ubiquitin-hydrolase Zn-finger-containing protein n=1 Tax=Streptosporangium canum TaxID=324952 RepID=A0A1I3XYG1_9ACTN|nr:UBP-type zinc finger domain-containing protein [Streptosporangium canum]SFK24667.1 ubiquitin-hydrolase Zn-finger-containing protein [Streptosporangium canum]
MPTCKHLALTEDPSPRTPQGCEECLSTGMRWVHLRRCLSCGHIGCCDSSPGKHATAHYKETDHPTVASFEPGEDWRWCYIDNIIG